MGDPATINDFWSGAARPAITGPVQAAGLVSAGDGQLSATPRGGPVKRKVQVGSRWPGRSSSRTRRRLAGGFDPVDHGRLGADGALNRLVE
jgi:hypothetical protein